MFCLLVLCLSQEVAWSHCSGTVPKFLSYEFKTGNYLPFRQFSSTNNPSQVPVQSLGSQIVKHGGFVKVFSVQPNVSFAEIESVVVLI